MYAIIQTGGKQYWVEEGTKLQVEKLEAESGSQIQLSEILLVSNNGNTQIGQPHLSSCQVTASVLRHLRGPKLIIFKKRSKKGFQKTQGHRQELTEIEIIKIEADSGGLQAQNNAEKSKLKVD